MAIAQNPRAARNVSQIPAGIGVAVGWAVMIGVAMVAAVLLPPEEVHGRAVLMAVAAGAFAALVTDPKVIVAVTALGAATFVGFLANQYGDLTLGDGAWSNAVVIVVGAVLGAGCRYVSTFPERRTTGGQKGDERAK
ncbi:MAG TPA: hypothetical protein VN408_01420 [Actinoplanes sp.]|nr:hypothetical protein [Actinoplanes sp.]